MPTFIINMIKSFIFNSSFNFFIHSFKFNNELSLLSINLLVVIINSVFPSLILILFLSKHVLLKFVDIISFFILNKIKFSFVPSLLYFDIHKLLLILLIPQKSVHICSRINSKG